MILNISIKLLFSLSLIVLTCFSMKNKRFITHKNKSESLFQSKSDTIIDKELAKMFDEEKKYWDSTCQAEIKRAEIDIKNKKLVYFHYFGMVQQYRSNQEMNILLKKHHIEVDSTGYFCTIPYELQNCYAKSMDKEIDKKFGKNFTDSLRHVAELHYVKKNLNKIYSFEECDTISRYPNDKSYREFFKSYERDFWKNIEYPEDFEYRKEKDYYSHISADFILSKTGKVSDIKIDLKFQNKKNYKYSSYFINQLKTFINNTKWIPAKSMGITINSKVPLTLFFK